MRHTIQTKIKISNTLKGKYRGKGNFNYKHGKYFIPHYCLNCGKTLAKKNPNSIRCRKCADKQHGIEMRGKGKGELNPYYKHGLSKNRKLYRDFRWKNDINFKLSCILRNRIRRALKYQKKSKSTKQLVSCTIPELKKHLKKTFTRGMTWQNYGKWHIDHAIPCASFDLSDPKQQQKCFHYSNLQALWAKENMIKSDKILRR